MSAPANAPGQAALGIPPLRRWSHAELLLAGLLLFLAGAGWLLAGLLATPDMQSGILTGARPMGEPMHPWPAEAGLFLLTWMVMMAAMMLPSIVPFTVGVARLMRLSGAGRGGTVTMTIAYVLIWAGTGVLAYPALRGLQRVSAGPTEVAVRVGAVVLLTAGVYQFTPLKRVCLRRCRSPLFLVMQHGRRATRSRLGALQTGIWHGAYCLGCCWALIAVLLAAGAMSLAWMGAIAAIVALEKASKRGEAISSALGGILIASGLLLLVAPSVLATSS
jgi:predicted metal-binding membrane protein